MRRKSEERGRSRARRASTAALLAGSGLLFLAACLALAAPALAEHTRWWRQSAFEEFDKGTAKGVALRSDGKIFLAPRFNEFADASLAYLLQIRADSKGNLYAAGGSNAKVLRIDASGKATSVFESQELAAQALALDGAGNIFVGTSPDGKVYKVTPGGQSSVFFDPKTKYIWDLVVDKDGTVYVATGDTGKIFSVSPNGNGQVFYSSEETHIRSLALDSNGNLLAGTEPSGRVLRIPKAANNRRAFVVYETSRKEITALLPGSGGELYVAAVGEKTGPSPAPRPLSTDTTTATSSFMISTGPAPAAAPAQAQQPIPFTPLPTINSSSVYRIAPDGSPEELWATRDDVVYSMGLLPGGKLLLGTGNDGAVLELEGNRVFSKLVKAPSRQITAIATGPGGKLYLAAANPGKVFSLGPDNETEGTFESQPYDAHIFSRWGRTVWWGENLSGAKNESAPRVAIYARSGNTSDPDSNWSDWAGPYSNPNGDKLDCPPARFVQWKAVLRGGAGTNAAAGTAPAINWFSIAYLPKNIAPVITAIAIQDPGVRTQSMSLPTAGPGQQTPAQLRMPQPPPSSSPSGAITVTTISNISASDAVHFDAVPQAFSQKGWESVLWTADDANDDQLEYSIYFRGENETAWKLLKDKLDSRFYSWDTSAMPDGAYYLKIVADDSPSNPAGEGLTSERESDRFVVANTPPSIAQLSVDAMSGGVRVRFQASAPVSFVARGQYSLDAGDWMLVFPSAGLSDAPREDYDFTLDKVASGEHTVTVRVYDQYENVSSAKATVKVK